MDLTIYVLLFIAGVLTNYIFTSGRVTKFERDLQDHLLNGRKVVIAVDNDAYIFELINGKVQVTRGSADLYDYDQMDQVRNGLQFVDVVGDDTTQSINNHETSD